MLTYQRFAKRTGYKFPEIESFRVSSLVNFVTVQTGISVEANRASHGEFKLLFSLLFLHLLSFNKIMNNSLL